MKTANATKHVRIIYGAVAFSLLALIGLAGPAYADDVRQSNDRYSGITTKGSTSYLDCVSGSISYNNRVFISIRSGQSQLRTGSTDPLEANGIVEVTESNGVNHFTAHQRDAWQDKGALLSAAQLCANS